MRILTFCFVLLSMLFSGIAYALDDYSVNIRVDVTDENSAEAQQKAIAGASKAAVLAAVKRMTDKDGVEKFSEMNNNQLINFIKETSVSDEKTSSNRYMANLHLVVNTKLLQTYMEERQITISEKIIPSIIVVPLLSEFNGDTPMLWELENSWKKAWDSQPLVSSVNLTSIKDSSGNISTLSAQQAFEADTDSLKKIKQLNGADDVYVLAASYDGLDGLNVKISSLSGYDDNIRIEGSKTNTDQLFNQAIAQIIPVIEEQASLLRLDGDTSQDDKITVLFPFNDLADWIAAEQKIKSLSEVSELQIQAFSPGKAQFIVFYQGDLDDLVSSFKAIGYDLEDSGNYMVLSYTGD